MLQQSETKSDKEFEKIHQAALKQARQGVRSARAQMAATASSGRGRKRR